MLVILTPNGTGDSNTCRPTLLHLPMGSRVTPRPIKVDASARLDVRNVFVLITTGRAVSLASKKANASFGVKRLKS